MMLIRFPGPIQVNERCETFEVNYHVSVQPRSDVLLFVPCTLPEPPVRKPVNQDNVHFFLLLLMCVSLTAFSYVYLASVCYIIMQSRL